MARQHFFVTLLQNGMLIMMSLITMEEALFTGLCRTFNMNLVVLCICALLNILSNFLLTYLYIYIHATCRAAYKGFADTIRLLLFLGAYRARQDKEGMH